LCGSVDGRRRDGDGDIACQARRAIVVGQNLRRLNRRKKYQLNGWRNRLGVHPGSKSPKQERQNGYVKHRYNDKNGGPRHVLIDPAPESRFKAYARIGREAGSFPQPEIRIKLRIREYDWE
jgi:hypothetical protein